MNDKIWFSNLLSEHVNVHQKTGMVLVRSVS